MPEHSVSRKFLLKIFHTGNCEWNSWDGHINFPGVPITSSITFMNALTDTLSKICFLQKYLIHKISILTKFGGDRNVGTIAQAVVTVGKSPSAKDNAASLRSTPGSYIWIDCWLFVRLKFLYGHFSWRLESSIYFKPRKIWCWEM